MKRFSDSCLRLHNWDYGWNGSYFITFSTFKKKPWFGRIENKHMYLSDIGQLANRFWKQIPAHFQSVILGEFIVMPDHIHGIININKTGSHILINGKPGFVKPGLGGSPGLPYKHGAGSIFENGDPINHGVGSIFENGDPINHGVGSIIAGSRQCLDPTKTNSPPSGGYSAPIIPPGKTRYGNPGKNNISSIIGSFKSIVTRNARINEPNFRWQARFWDVLIQNENHYHMVERYIQNNPQEWNKPKRRPSAR